MFVLFVSVLLLCVMISCLAVSRFNLIVPDILIQSTVIIIVDRREINEIRCIKVRKKLYSLKLFHVVISNCSHIRYLIELLQFNLKFDIMDLAN